MFDQPTAIISDIHANLEALQAVLAHLADQRIEHLICLGDVVGYGPNPRECIDACRSFDCCLLGNHDNGALFDPDGFNAGAERAIFWTREQLEDTTQPGAAERWDFLAKLPRTRRVGDLLFVHGSPRSPLNEYVFPEDVYNQRKMERIFALVPRYCFHGHTHVPGVFTERGRFFTPAELGHSVELKDEKLLINVGSVGQPRDLNPQSCFVVLTGRRVEFQRVSYDCQKTCDKILAIPELDPFSGQRLIEGK